MQFNFLHLFSRPSDPELIHTKPAGDLAGKTDEREAVAFHLTQQQGERGWVVGIKRPTAMPQLLIRPEQETKRFRRPVRIRDAQRMADVVPSRVEAVNPEEALSAVKPQGIPAKINGHLRVAQINGIRIDPASIEQQREDGQWLFRRVRAPACVVHPYVARVAYAAFLLPGGKNKDVAAPATMLA